MWKRRRASKHHWAPLDCTHDLLAKGGLDMDESHHKCCRALLNRAVTTTVAKQAVGAGAPPLSCCSTGSVGSENGRRGVLYAEPWLTGCMGRVPS